MQRLIRHPTINRGSVKQRLIIAGVSLGMLAFIIFLGSQLFDIAMSPDGVYSCCKRDFAHGGTGWDFGVFRYTASLMRGGASPYSYHGYVYTPLVAVLTVPTTYLSAITAWHLWTAIEFAIVGATVVIFTVTELPGRVTWRTIALFGFAAVTATYFFPISRVITLGQVDTLTMLMVICGAWMQSRARAGRAGVFLGLAVIVKVWPILFGLALLQRGLPQRRRTFIGFAITVACAPILMMIFGGLSGPKMFFDNIMFSPENNQYLVSHSAWGTARLLFTATGLANPILISPTAYLATGVIATLIICGLILLAIRTPGDRNLCLWNIAGCSILLLPMAHVAYTVLFLPIVWIWGARVLDPATRSKLSWAVFAVCIAYWVLQTQSWQDDQFNPNDSIWLYCMMFFLNITLCVVSIGGNWLIHREEAATLPRTWTSLRGTLQRVRVRTPDTSPASPIN